jgi:retron-type reverse transcriptase
LENLSSKQNELQTWEQIPKVKWEGLPKQEDVNQLIAQNQELTKSKPLLVIEGIQKRIHTQLENNQQVTPIANIYDVLCHPDILRIAYAKVMKNKGALTPGSDPNITADTFAGKQIQELSQSLKKGTFKWKPVRRIMIEKPGKKEKRPLGLPDFDDKVVQGAILLILEEAYEAEFEKLNCNFGFRPNKDTNGAMEKINMEARFFQFAVEGDIKGAYDTVQHKTLMSILGERFTDKKFLRLIQNGLEGGIVLNFIRYETLLGTPQGSICSPILFNIYMQAFDKFVLKDMLNLLQPQNTDTHTPPPTNEINVEYEKYRSRKRAAKRKLEDFQKTHQRNLEQMMLRRFVEYFQESPYVNQVLAKNKEINTTLQKLQNNPQRKDTRLFREAILKHTNEEQQEILKKEYEDYLTSIFKESLNKQKSTNYKDPEKLEKKITYVRYADDWIIFVRGTQEDAEKAKDLAAEFLLNRLGLTLSLEKTKITDLYNNKARFLGYEIFYQRNKKNQTVNKGTEERVTQRFGNIQFHPDKERLENRFKLKKYMTKSGKPKEVGFLTALQDHEIITKYNQFMIGLGNYYIRQIKYSSRLGYWHYQLYYSCIKTLAAKHKTSVKDIIKTYGYTDLSNPTVNRKRTNATDLRIIAHYKFNQQEKTAILLNYKEFMFQLQKIKDKYIEEKLNDLPHDLVREADMLTLHKVNFRTAFKETSFCAICGKKEKSLHSHHIRPLKWKNDPKSKAYRGFDKAIAALGRKQIPVCSDCHHKIHAGKYNDMELNEIYDVRLVAPEGLFRFNNTPPNSQPINPSQKTTLLVTKEKNITIDELRKTYLNREFKNYLQKKQNYATTEI